MANNEQTGYFEIDASNISSTDPFLVPKDKTGVAPSGKDNDDQTKYDLSIDGESHDWYVHIVNTTGVAIDSVVKGTHLFDENFEEAAEIDSTKNVSSSGQGFFSGGENPSYLGVEITPNQVPSNGKIKVIIQKASV